MDILSGYDRMMLAEDPTEVNEPITSQSSEMPSPYEDQATEAETFEALNAGATIFDGMGETGPVNIGAPTPSATPMPPAAPPKPATWIPGVPNVAVIAGVGLLAFFLLRKKG